MKRVIWLFDDDHTFIPFIPLGAESLSRAGADVVVLDTAEDAVDSSYRHRPLVRRQGLAAPKGSRLARLLAAQVLTTSLSQPSVIVASGVKAVLAGALGKLLTRARLVYYPFELYAHQIERRSRFWLRLERFLLRHAVDTVITQNSGRAEVLRTASGERLQPIVVRNLKSMRQPPAVPAPPGLHRLAGLDAGTRIVVYEGFLKGGRYLKELVLAAPEFPPDVHLVLMGVPLPWWEEHIVPLLDDERLAARITVLPMIPHEEVRETIRDAAVGVMLYDRSALNYRYAEPGKFSDYVLAGVPVLTLDLPTVAPAVRELGLGVVLDGADPLDIARGVKEALATPAWEWRERLSAASHRLCWEGQEEHFVDSVVGLSAA